MTRQDSEKPGLVAPTPGHSRLGASSYSRWKACPGCVKLSEGVTRTESEYAKRGTEAHDEGAGVLKGKLWSGRFDGEELESIKIYVNYIEELRSQKPEWELIEKHVNLTELHPDLWGTCDYICYFPLTRTLVVVDYKHGSGVPVNVLENVQLLYYGACALFGSKVPIAKVQLTIVQPRCYHLDGAVRSWEVTPQRILDFTMDLVDDAEATEKPNAALNPGDHCRWCPAQGICPALHNKAVALAAVAFAPTTKYDPEKLSQVLTALPQIEAWAKGVREFAYREAQSGRVPPGFKLVDKRASRKWVDKFSPRTHAAKLGLEENDFYEEKLLSVPQIEKLIPKDKKEVLDKYTVKESSGQNLVPIEDDRPALDKLGEMFPT